MAPMNPWLTAVILLLLFAIVGMMPVFLLLMWENFKVMQRIERIWGAWIDTDQVAKPAPMPGSRFLISDAEMAAREKMLMSESKDRAAVSQRQANPGSWTFQAGQSPARPSSRR